MNQITTLHDAQLGIVRRTVAQDLTDPEFDLFIARCRNTGLDPFKRQICAVVYNKDKPDKRKVTFITEIAGYRSLAEKAGNYRPAETDDDERLETDDEAKDDTTNPQGIVSATYYAYKQDGQGDWHRVRGKVWWEEYAPISEIWEYDQAQGKRQPTGRFELQAGNWRRMGRHMLMKCAEAHALRKGWPDQIPGDLYTGDEMALSDLEEQNALAPASEQLAAQEQAERRTLIGGPAISLLWAPDSPMEGVPVGQVADRCLQFIDEQTDAEALRAWQETNAVGLRQFWAESKSDALAVKRAIEGRIKELTP